MKMIASVQGYCTIKYFEEYCPQEFKLTVYVSNYNKSANISKC